MKKQNYSLILLLFASLSFVASSCMKDDDGEKRAKEKRLIENYVQVKNITVAPTASGLYYVPTVEGTGATPTEKQFVLITYKATDLEGVFFDGTDKDLAEQNKVYPTFALGGPMKYYVTPVNSSIFLPGVSEGLKMMKEGGKATMIMPSILAYNDYIPRIIEVELLKVISNPEAYEREQIANFLDTATNLTPKDSTSSGVYYAEKVPGTGTFKPSTGNTVSIKFNAHLTDGRVFSYTQPDSVYKFVVGGTADNDVIDGLDEGIRLMTKGGKATIVIPYYRGYGFDVITIQGQIVIPYFSTLIYDVELVDIKN